MPPTTSRTRRRTPARKPAARKPAAPGIQLAAATTTTATATRAFTLVEAQHQAPEMDAEQATALNMERAAQLATNGVGGLLPPAARITTGPMTPPPATVVTHHAPAIVAETAEPSVEDYAAVLDPEIAAELRALGLHPEQVGPLLQPPPAPDVAAPPVPVQPPPPISPGGPGAGGTAVVAGPPIAAMLSYSQHGDLRLAKLIGHARVQSWPLDLMLQTLGLAQVLAEVLAAFGITVLDLAAEDKED